MKTSLYISYTDRRRILTFAIVLIVAWIPLSATGQFIRITLDIPPKTGVSGMDALELNVNNNPNGIQTYDGAYVLCITGTENMQVLATLLLSDSQNYARVDGRSIKAELAFQNDGNSQKSGTYSGHSASFPLNNSGLLIENIKGKPLLLNAYLFIHATILPQYVNTIENMDLCLNIEYN